MNALFSAHESILFEVWEFCNLCCEVCIQKMHFGGLKLNQQLVIIQIIQPRQLWPSAKG